MSKSSGWRGNCLWAAKGPARTVQEEWQQMMAAVLQAGGVPAKARCPLPLLQVSDAVVTADRAATAPLPLMPPPPVSDVNPLFMSLPCPVCTISVGIH